MTHVPLKHLCTDAGQYGYNWPATDYVTEDTGLRMLRTTDLRPTGLLPADEGIFVPRPVPQEFTLRTQDILLTRSGTIGRCYLVPDAASGLTFAGFLVRFRPRPDADARFIAYALQSRPVQEQIQAEAISSTIQNFNAERYANLPLPRVPLEEQRRVANFLDDQVALLDRAIHLRQRQRSVFEERTATLVRMALTGGDLPRRSSGSAWFPQLPHGWSVCLLKQRWRVIDCKHRTPEYRTSGFPVVSTGDVSPGRLDLGGATRYIDETDFADLADTLRRPRRGDIVYSRNASLGTACYVDLDEPFSMGQDVCRITSDEDDQLHLTHALNYLMGPQIDHEKVGSTFSRINVSKILGLAIPMPPTREEAHDLGLVVDDILETSARHVDALSRSVALLQERTQALVTAAVTGEFDVATASSRSVA